MKKFLSIILCMTALFALSNCSKDEEITTGTITGLVSDMTNSNTAIPGATVTLSPLGLSKTTGSDGRYEFTDIAPGAYTVAVSANGYQSDTKSIVVYTAQVATGDFQLAPASTPVTISPLSLSFGPTNESLTFSLVNQSNRSLQYNISGYPSYLTVTPSSAQVAAKGTQTITVKVNRGAITADVSTQLTVNVGNDSYSVNININSQDLTSKMSVTPSSLDFGTSYTTLQFSIRNVGTGGDLTWNISSPTEACLSVSPSSGVTAIGNSTPVTVTLDRNRMQGNITAFINVNTNGGAVPVTVTASKSGDNGDGDNTGTGTGTGGGTAVTAGLQAYYTFDNEDASDATDYGLDGVLFNNPTFTTDTPNGSGKAVFLSTVKDQYITIPYNPFKDINSYSISCWVKDFGAGTFLGCINGTSWSTWVYFRCAENNQFYFGSYSSHGFVYDSNTLLDNQWHMLTLTHTGSTAKLYIDGKLVDTRNWSGIYGPDSSPGMRIQNTMKLDNMRLYNRELTASDVKAIYSAER